MSVYSFEYFVGWWRVFVKVLTKVTIQLCMSAWFAWKDVRKFCRWTTICCLSTKKVHKWGLREAVPTHPDWQSNKSLMNQF